nr:SAM-dependent methyltransferase [Gammaproteobacteria bacterium]
VKFGAAGDFITAPEISPLFARCIARALTPVFDQLGGGTLLEIGPGSGAMVKTLLPALAELGRLPHEYLLLEVSAELRDRQRAALLALDPALRDRVRWLDELPASRLRGVILANEVVDALPVSRFVWRDGQARPLGVGMQQGEFQWTEGEPDRHFAERVSVSVGRHADELPNGYRSEFCPGLAAWLQSCTSRLDAGLVLLSDYGLVGRDYYNPLRHDGTLICHYRHRSHANPFWCPGGQDISAWVDFSSLAVAARAAGLELAGYTTQAQFLLAHGIETEAAAAGGSPREIVEHAQAMRKLLLPGEMGEYFKFMALTRKLEPGTLPLGRDLTGRL